MDLLAINQTNFRLACRFDTCDMKQIILPICDDLETKLRRYMKEKRKDIFTVAETRLKASQCRFYTISTENNFFLQQLKDCFPAKNKIKNNIQGLTSNLGGLNLQLT